MAKRYVVTLTGSERQALEQRVRSGRESARKITRRGSCSRPTTGRRTRRSSTAVGVGRGTVGRARKRFSPGGAGWSGPGTARSRRGRPGGGWTGRPRPELTTLACSTPPDGRPSDAGAAGRPDGAAELRDGTGDRVAGHGRAAPKKNEIKPWLKRAVVHPAGRVAEFVAAHGGRAGRLPPAARPGAAGGRAGREARSSCGDVRRAAAGRPGSPAKADYEYVRNGTANLFVAFEPLGGWRQSR